MMRPARWLLMAGYVLATGTAAAAGAAEAMPNDFPQFIVPGHEQAMSTLRSLYWLHYQHYRSHGKPMPTAWDEWMTGSTLWPAVGSTGGMSELRRHWAEGLGGRVIDPEGYVSSHQHASIAHQQGWPFPFWQQGGPGTWGWHFSLRGVPHNWDGSPAKTQEAWSLEGARDLGISDHAWNIELTAAGATATTPPLEILPEQSPFIQLRWRAEGLADAQPFLEWATEKQPGFDAERRFHFDPPGRDRVVVFTMIPVFKSPAWQGRITRLRICFDNPQPGAHVGIQALFTQYDTRHNVNNSSFVRGCCQYFHWTRDLNFLRANLQRMRLAVRYMMEDLGGRREKCIVAPFVGHDGRSGIELQPDGRKIIHSGRGTGNNYWDILPMGYRDAYATIQYYDALGSMARLEQEVEGHPQWNLPAGPLALDADDLHRHAAEVKEYAGKLFWNTNTGRFVAGIDRDGRAYDYGFTFVNCEAVHYGFATDAQAESIVQWLTGERIVAGDTSQAADIYHWRFGPRSTTKRNIDWYGWYWYAPESLPWGGQVQDGGAVLGFSYHDLQTRLKTRGPNNAWARLREIIKWFDEVQASGGYREYYKDGKRGTLQGCGPTGGLGLDCEFYESILVPQIMISGFLGFEPRSDGFGVFARLPAEWPRLTVTRIHFQRLVLDVTAGADAVTVSAHGRASEPLAVYLPAGGWQVACLAPSGAVLEQTTVEASGWDKGIPIDFDGDTTVRFIRSLPGASDSAADTRPGGGPGPVSRHPTP